MSFPDPRNPVDYLAVGAGRPVVRQPHLPRPRLHALLDAGVEDAVTLVRAGAGWGKTTLVAAWAAQRPAPDRVAWLSLRHRHTGVAAVSGGIAAALLAAGARLPAAGPVGADTVDSLQRRLRSGFDQVPEPTVLVLDDLHVLDGSPAMLALAVVVTDPPAGLRLVLLSRGEPALPLAEPGVAGRVTVLDAGDLALDEAEAADLAALYGGTDPAAGEGWPLGLRLAAETAGPDAIDDYLWREVVAVRPAALRRFLLRTSIVDELSPELAGRLSGAVDSLRILQDLECGLGFLTSRDGDQRWFRLHGQMRAMLRRRLELEAPDELARLHAAAARWYADELRAPEALWHAAEAADWVYLGRLVAELAVTRIVSAERRFVVDAVQRIPPQFLPTTPELALCAALLMLVTGDYSAIPEWIARARAMLAGRPPEQRRAVEAALDTLEAPTVVRFRGDMPGLVTITTRILARLRAATADEIPMLLQLRAVAVSNKGVGLLWTGRFDQAERYLWSGLRASRAAGLELVEINAEGHLALLALFRGALGAAEEHALAARRLAGRHGLATTAQAAAGHLALALVEVERDRIPQAQAVLRTALHIEANPAEATLAVLSSVALVLLLLAADDAAAAGPYLRQVRQETGPALDAPFLQRWLDLVESEIDLALGDPGPVAQRYRDRSMPTPAEQALLGRALIALGEVPAGTGLLTRAAAGPNRIAAVQALIALGLLAGDRGEPSDAIDRAMILAEPDGIRRPFRLLPAGRAEAAPENRPAAGPAGPLSEREAEVLRFLPSVLTAQEIAGNLGVSVNTVKAHMRAIYRKLGAARRREAVDIAHHRGML
ncbi:LuxR C-terminal-related transcriptional regulator [Actinoplanes sp. NPDC024001]|uniref:LuxR C-terminal-related transcriptional regulator n=1 Tax=Actinoplanes sp. NPDC024001 TaxID=3154598 RepID=UPI00340D699F